MNKVYEVTKRDGTKQLITNKFLKDIVRAIKNRKYKQDWRKENLYCQMLSNLCFLNGWKRIDEITYGLDCPIVRKYIIEEA